MTEFVGGSMGGKSPRAHGTPKPEDPEDTLAESKATRGEEVKRGLRVGGAHPPSSFGASSGNLLDLGKSRGAACGTGAAAVRLDDGGSLEPSAFHLLGTLSDMTAGKGGWMVGAGHTLNSEAAASLSPKLLNRTRPEGSGFTKG